MSASIKLDLAKVLPYPESRGLGYFAAWLRWYGKFSRYMGAQGISALSKADYARVPGRMPPPGTASGADEAARNAARETFINQTGCADEQSFARMDRAAYTLLQTAFAPNDDPDVSPQDAPGWPAMLDRVISAG